MPRLQRQDEWNDLRAGDVFRVPGVPRRRFRFRALVTNVDSGDVYVDAADTSDGRFRAFRADTPVRKERRRVTRDGTVIVPADRARPTGHAEAEAIRARSRSRKPAGEPAAGRPADGPAVQVRLFDPDR